MTDISRLQDAMAAYSRQSASDTQDSNGVDNTIFKDLVTDSVSSTRDALRTGEAQATLGAVGKGDITDLVFTLNEAEMKLKTIVSLRDRLVSSLQEIFRMPI